jgi:hypothetical protein
LDLKLNFREELAMKKIIQLIFTSLIFVLISTQLFAQRQPDPNVGDQDLRRIGIMDGSLVRSLFINWGEIAHWPESPSGEWPKGSGHQYVDGVALVVQANARDNQGNVIHPMETQYREFVDTSPQDKLWGWAPLPGYFNPEQEKPAMSNDPHSWPNSWPDKFDGWINPNEIRNDIDDDGNGIVDDLVFWNGFFGKGVFNADVETFFVFDDDPDEEWDFYPDPSDTTRRGLGLEVAARYFQWSQVLAEDVIFAVYFITNEGKTNYDSTYYCFYIDWGIGGTDDSSDDTGDYDTFLDIAWAWDGDNKGTPGDWSPVGFAGFAFLESPGIDDDGLDNDDDGIIDENRTSVGPGFWIDTPPYVDDPIKFLEYYKREAGPHWSNDEDADWVGYSDINQNGLWDEGEPLNSDVGEDGLTPDDFSYPGPDNGEGDGEPTAGEPDFDFLDKDEADQIGLTGFRIFPVHQYELWNEEQNWEVFRSAPQPASSPTTANLGMFFSSGPFPLEAGDTQNYSMALLFGDDKDDLVATKGTIQQIYNADYRFAKPPDKPEILSVIPGDGKVTLVWDERAESSWDPFLREFDFEGYRIYRSTESQFLETRLITDSYGRATFRKPLVQFDLENDIQGLHQIDIQGAHFNMGENTGLKHFYVDEDVTNGQTYYYAVVSFDHGFIKIDSTGARSGIPPSECTSKIQQDISGNVQVDINTAVVIPHAPAAGYITPELEEGIVRETIGTGSVSLEFIFPDSVLDGHTYSIDFGDTSLLHYQGNPYYVIYDITNNQKLALTDTIWIDEISQSPLVDGFTVAIENDEADIDGENSWASSHTTYRPRLNQDIRGSSEGWNINYPADFEIIFSDVVVDTSDNLYGLPLPREKPTKFKVNNITENTPAHFHFQEFYKFDSTLTPFLPGQNLDSIEAIMIWVENPEVGLGWNTSWRFYFEADDTLNQVPPQPGDVFHIATKKPFRLGDKISFTLRGKDFSKEKAKVDMDKIAVVPNPYVSAASWEPKSPFKSGRGERRIYFINLPPQCTIRIYTVRGYLVDTIEHNDSIENGSEPWNMLSKDGQEIAYGVYIYHIDAPGIGERVSKFAVIK